MNVAFLFPGQGSQSVGMGAEWIETHPRREWLELAGEVVGEDMPALCLHGPKEALDRTIVTQPALYVLGAMLLNDLEAHGVRPVAVAGHSAGEYAALLAAGAWEFETGLRVIAARARIMFETGLRAPGGMAAILGLDGDSVEAICREVFPEGDVVVANRNTPVQTVISGKRDSVDEVCGVLKERGARRVIRLAVSGAFHSPLLEQGATEFAAYLESIDIKPTAVAWISNRTGKAESSPPVIREHLAGQLISPVQWIETMTSLDRLNCDRFLEVGPGRVLTGLAKGCGTGTACTPVGSPKEIEAILREGAKGNG